MEPTKNMAAVESYEQKKNMQILRGQCLNCSAAIASGDVAKWANPKDVVSYAKKLFEELKAQNFLEW